MPPLKHPKHLAFAGHFLKAGAPLSAHSGGAPDKKAPCDGWLVTFATEQKSSETDVAEVFVPAALVRGGR